ncbi:MAG: oligosaccharide flippase family protein [Lachnospiraceae bacterium]|nr:oligosaccharide flippase family protein [Lachnospiraceae bacterium]
MNLKNITKELLVKYENLPIQMRASVWFLICGFLQRGISVITTPIFTRIMTTAEYGQYNVFSSWMSIITCFVSLNLYGGVYAQGLVKFESRRPQFAAAFQGLLFTLTCAWTVVYLIFRQPLNELLSLTTFQGILMLVLIWTSSVFQLWAQEERANFRYKTLVWITLLFSVCTPALGILFIFLSEDSVTARILGMALTSILLYSWMFAGQIKKGKTFFSKEIWVYALGLALPLIPHYLSQMILSGFDRIMISELVGDAKAGIYSLAYAISSIMIIFNTSLMSTVEPWVYRKIKEKELDRIAQIAYPCFVMIALINLVLIIMAPEIIRIFAPAEYYEAIWVIPPLAMGVYFMFLYTFFAMFEFYYEKTKYISTATLVGAVANVILNYICIKLFGYIAAAYTTLFCYIIYVVMHYCFMRKVCREYLNNAKVYELKILLAITAGFMLLSFGMMFLYEHLVLRYGVLCVMLVIVVIKRKVIIEFVKAFLSEKKAP